MARATISSTGDEPEYTIDADVDRRKGNGWPLEATVYLRHWTDGSRGHQRAGECCSFDPLWCSSGMGDFLSVGRLDERGRPKEAEAPPREVHFTRCTQHGEADFELEKALRARQGGQ